MNNRKGKRTRQDAKRKKSSRHSFGATTSLTISFTVKHTHTHNTHQTKKQTNTQTKHTHTHTHTHIHTHTHHHQGRFCCHQGRRCSRHCHQGRCCSRSSRQRRCCCHQCHYCSRLSSCCSRLCSCCSRHCHQGRCCSRSSGTARKSPRDNGRCPRDDAAWERWWYVGGASAAVRLHGQVVGRETRHGYNASTKTHHKMARRGRTRAVSLLCVCGEIEAMCKHVLRQ